MYSIEHILRMMPEFDTVFVGCKLFDESKYNTILVQVSKVEATKVLTRELRALRLDPSTLINAYYTKTKDSCYLVLGI